MNLVNPEGSLGARFVIVGGRPGEDEAFESHRPFTGPSGRLLNQLLPIPRSECYLTNVRRDFSHSNSMPTRGEVQEALPALRDEISRTKANIIIALGTEPLFALTGMNGIDKYRGSVLPCTLVEGRKVIGTYHPAACLRTYHLTYILQRDLRRALRESSYPEIRRRERLFRINPILDESLDIISKWGSPLSIDIETFGERPDCVGAGDSPDNATCFPFIGGNYTDSELSILWRALARAFYERDVFGQNFQFDTTRLERLGFRFPNIVFDTMLAHHLLWPELGGASKRTGREGGVDALAGKHSLAFLTSMYTDEPYYKDEGGFHGDFERRWTYNCKDVAYTYECYEGLKTELETFGQTSYFKEHILGLLRPVMAMQARGLCVDFDALNKTRHRMDLENQCLQLRLNHNLGFDCNVKSPDHIRYLIQEVLKLSIVKRTKKTQKPSTDEDTIRTLAHNSPHAELFQRILDIRERRTMLSGFLGLETDPDDGRYKVNFLIHGTDSSRLSSRSARKGPQLQNIPYAARRVFRAAPGYILIQGDLAKADATYVAYDAEDEDLISIFTDRSRDLYIEFGQEVLGYAFKKDSIERKCFKSGTHAAHYGMREKKFLIVLRMAGINIDQIPVRGISKPLSKCKYFLEAYHAKHPNIRSRWHKGIIEQIKNGRRLFDSFGRIRIFLGRIDDELFRKAFAYRPRSTVGGITNRALRILHGRSYATVLQVHDSITIEVLDDEENISDGINAVKESMECELELHGRRFVIPVDIQVGHTWGAMHEWKPGGKSERFVPGSIPEIHTSTGES